MTSNSGIADRTYNTNPAGLLCHGYWVAEHAMAEQIEDEVSAMGPAPKQVSNLQPGHYMLPHARGCQHSNPCDICPYLPPRVQHTELSCVHHAWGCQQSSPWAICPPSALIYAAH